MSVIPKRRRRKAEINIVPLVDVLVVLIFFFLVSMQFRNLTMLNLTLPRIESAGREEPTDSVQIGVDVEGQYFLNGQPIEEGPLVERIEEVSRLSPDTPVIIMADENSLLRKVTFVMDTCRKAGLEKVRLQAR
ncbi:MAG TPA: biopolymer transporter ExbD [Oceanipulchritudo sp.]|nr:biopolymer transporter ExbD [Oceanipulchritudo sp.]